MLKSYSEASIVPYENCKDTEEKKIPQTYFLSERKHRFFSKIPTSQIQEHIKKMVRHGQVGFISGMES